MDGNNDGMGSPYEDVMDIRLQTSKKLDLNVEQDCSSPKVSNFNETQFSISSKDESNSNGVLKIGMEFDTDEHAYRFYNKYAGLVGFSVRKDWVNRSKVHGQVVSRKFTCSREGYRRKDKRDVNVKKHRKETRTGCLAHMIVTRQPDGKYGVTHLEASHNHESVNPSNAQILQSELQMSVAQANDAELANNSETESKSAFELMGRRFGVLEPLDYVSLDCDHHLQSGRLRDMKEGEAGRLLHYFQRQHFENPSFFYAVQLDIDDKVSNIFWADDNMIVDYDNFSDMICLETTYRTNKDFRPLVLFIGVNHHRQVVIFGAALLYDESVDSLKWLLQTFIEAMSGKKPKAILTDQDATTVEAVASVLPETNHCVCLWQMYQNALKHLSYVVKDTDSFAKDFRNCIFYHDDEEEFIHAWEAMLEKYGLLQNEWLRWMYREREKWAVVYGRNTFFVNLKGMHMGEMLSDNLKYHLSPDIDVLQFFKHFERVVDEQRCKEVEANYDMTRCKPRLMGNVVLLKHASDIYTPKVFEVFQREYEKSLNVVVNHCGENNTLFKYKANKFGQPREYTVTFNSSDNTVLCSCMMFENVGVLCCHALKVLDQGNIKVAPSQYILKRWTQDARIESHRDCNEHTVQENPRLVSATWYKDLCQSIFKISARAAESEEAYQFAKRQLGEVMQGVEKILTFKPTEVQIITSSSTGANASETQHAEVFLDSNVLEGQDGDSRENGTQEKENALSDEGQLKVYYEKNSMTKSSQNVEPPTPDAVASISCPPLTYDSAQTPTAGPAAQNLYNFEENQVAHCMYQPPNLVVDPQSNSNLYQPPHFFSSQHDSPSHSHFIQESLIHSTYQESISNNTHMRQEMDLDLQQPHSSSFALYDHRFRTSDTQYFGSK